MPNAPNQPIHPRGLLITGTDTGVGKTVVTAAVARRWRAMGRRVGIFKPACSGCVDSPSGPRWQDVEDHFAALGGEFPRKRICPQCFAAPLAPPAAAAAEEREVDENLLMAGAAWWRDRCEILLVEGVGGFLCPLTGTTTIADFAVALGLPVLIVARAGLGTINHSLLTIEAVRRRGLPLTGVVLNESEPDVDASGATNAATIARFGECPVLSEISHKSRNDLPGGDRDGKMNVSDVWDRLAANIEAGWEPSPRPGD